MAALHRLCGTLAAAAILLSAAGCSPPTADPVQLDIMLTSSRSDTVDTTRPDKLSPVSRASSARSSYAGEIGEMRSINPDAIGWLQVPGTDISDIVLNTPESKSNDYYLNIDIYKRPDRNGTYCTDIRTRFGSGLREDLSRNTTIYGHSWTDDANGDLFAQLKRYRDPDFAASHPYIHFSTEAEDMVWEVFAVFDTHVDLPYINPNPSSAKFFDMLDIVYEASLYRYPVTVGPQDKILTLSTCTYSVEGHPSLSWPNDYRFAVMARLVERNASLRKSATFVINDYPLSPDDIRSTVRDGGIREYAWGAKVD